MTLKVVYTTSSTAGVSLTHYTYPGVTKSTIKAGAPLTETINLPLDGHFLFNDWIKYQDGVGEFPITVTNYIDPAQAKYYRKYGIFYVNLLPSCIYVSVAGDTLQIHVPDHVEYYYSTGHIGRDKSLFQYALQGQLTSLFATNKQNIHNSAYYIHALHTSKPGIGSKLQALLRFGEHKTYLRTQDAFEAANAMREYNPHKVHIVPLISATALSPRARTFISGTAVSSTSETGQAHIVMPTTTPLVDIMIMNSSPAKAPVTLNIVSFLTDVAFVKKTSVGFLSPICAQIVSIYNILAPGKHSEAADIIAPEALESQIEKTMAEGAKGTGDFRFDFGFFGGFNTLSPVGGIFAQLRPFVSWNQSDPTKLTLHLRLLNYAGASTPNGVVDGGLFQLVDLNTSWDIKTGAIGNWKQSIGVYALGEISFPLNDKTGAINDQTGFKKFVNELYRVITEPFKAVAHGIRDLGAVGSWVRDVLPGGVQQTFNQLLKVESALQPETRTLTSRFGGLEGQLGGYAGFTITTDFGAILPDNRLGLLVSEMGGASVGAVVGSLLGWLSFTLSGGLVPMPTVAGIADASAELGAFTGAAVFSYLHRTHAELSFDAGGWLYAASKSQSFIPAMNARVGWFAQANALYSERLHVFN